MLGGIKRIFGIFTDVSRDVSFERRLKRRFGHATAQSVLSAIEKLGLPMPTDGEFVKGSEGPLILLNDYNLAIRIDPVANKGRTLGFNWDRINDSPFVLRPIGSVIVGKAVVEICAGAHQTADKNVECELQRQLKESGLYFWDSGLMNVGILPVKTPDFPNGIPVVIDRLAVRKLSRSANIISKAVQEASLKEEEFYAPLRQAFLQAWPAGAENPDASKMKAFWAICHDYARAGKLVAGWSGAESQNSSAKDAAKKYAEHSFSGGLLNV